MEPRSSERARRPKPTYLAFLEQEMAKHPEMIQPLSPELLVRAEALVGDLEVDLDEDLGDDFEIDDPYVN